MRTQNRRRLFLLAASVALIGTGCVGGTKSRISPFPLPGESIPPKGGNPSGHPNLILILTDDQRFDSLWAMPNMERLLARHGVTFRNFFVTTSLCCPSRASILTGQYSRHTGVYDDAPPHGGAPAFHDASTLATWLHGAGYETSLVGKYLNAYRLLDGGRYIPPGWDDWHVMVGPGLITRYYDYLTNDNGRLVGHAHRPFDYSTRYLANQALDFIQSAHQPFFLYFAPIAPHLPSIPAPGDAHRFDSLPPARPLSFNEADLSDKPWASREPLWGSKHIAAVDAVRRHMLRTLLEVDRAVGAIVQALRARGELDNTVIAYTSDNGFLLGEHRLVNKIWPYEESIRVPLVIRTPWQGPPGRTDDHLTLNIDLASTFAQLAGVTPGLPQDGRSLVPLLLERRTRWRHAFVEEFLGRGNVAGSPPRFTAIRTTRYIYIEYATGWRELYDLRSDPFELHNLAGSPQMLTLEGSLNRELKALLARPPG